MAEDNLKDKTISGLIWQFAQKGLNQGISFVVTVILARLLMPEDYGVVALAGMFNILIGVFLDNGLGAALIQKKDTDELDYNTVFFSNFFMSFVVYAVIFVLSPYAARLYDNELICPIMRIMSLTLPIGALAGVQNATVQKALQFKKFFYTSLVGQIFSAIVGVYMAYSGSGPWALVGQSITSSVVNCFVMFFLVTWHPKFMFSFQRFKGMFSYAWKKQAAGIIGTVCFQLKGYLIGYKYSTSDLAYYNRGEGLPDMFMNNINGTINGVLFPALARVQSDPEAVKHGIRRSMMTSSYVLCPILFGLAAMSAQIVPVLYSEKWEPAIPFMQVACLTCCMTVLNTANLQALLAIGKSDEVLKLEFYKKPVMIAILASAIFISPLAISVGLLIYSVYVLAMNTIPNKKHLGYSIWEQINDVKAAFILSGLMAVIVYSIGLLDMNIYILMVMQFIVGATLYISLSHFLKLESYVYVLSTIKEIYSKRFNRR